MEKTAERHHEAATITTRTFRTGTTPHVREAIRHLAGRFWWIVAAPIFALALYGVCIDWRYLIVTLCVIFLLVPTFALVGFNMLLMSESATRAMFPQQVSLSPDGVLTVEYSMLPATEKQPERPGPKPEVIPRRHIDRCELWRNSLVIKYGGTQTLIIPADAFETQNDIVEFYHRLIPGV